MHAHTWNDKERTSVCTQADTSAVQKKKEEKLCKLHKALSAGFSAEHNTKKEVQ